MAKPGAPTTASLQTVVEEPNDAFVGHLVDQIRRGGEITPFIGSGCSAASGIMMGTGFAAYLEYTLYRCIAPTKHLKANLEIDQRWNLDGYGWPTYPVPSESLAIAREWVETRFNSLLESYTAKAYALQQQLTQGSVFRAGASSSSTIACNAVLEAEKVANAILTPLWPSSARAQVAWSSQPYLRKLLTVLNSANLAAGGYNVSTLSPTSEDAIIEQGIRSLHDWRATLQFLSRIKLVGEGIQLLPHPDQGLIDSFSQHITKDRKPNLTHNMVCHLSGPARFRVIITTNFDTLIEDAFRNLNEDTAVIDVGVRGELPSPRVVHAKNTILKIHGSLNETRADFSLDESPSLYNKRAFFHYVHGHYPDASGALSTDASHLLVVGYSGSDNRCVEMFKYLLETSNSKIFWICHSHKDLEKLRQDIFLEQSFEKRITATVCPRTDLLLYELFQHLSLGLPKGGFSYQYTANVPPAIPRHIPATHNNDIKDLIEFVEQKTSNGERSTQAGKIVEWLKQNDKVKELAIIDGNPGVMATLRNVVTYVSYAHLANTIWLELEDYADTNCVAYELLLIIALSLGRFQRNRADLVPQSIIDGIQSCANIPNLDEKSYHEACKELWETHIREVLSIYLKTDQKSWLVVLYGRNGPGGCASWGEAQFWPAEEHKVFLSLIDALRDLGFNLIYAPYSESRSKRDAKKWPARQGGSGTYLLSIIERQYQQHLRNPRAYEKLATQAEYKGPSHFGIPDWIKGLKEFPPDPPSAKSDIISFEDTMKTVADEFIGKVRPGNKASHRKLRFLYASTLFRQSRHYSAFLNDATLQCPGKFNTDCEDNDWNRHEELKGYLENLKNKVFYQKPGGFAWAYRDFRLGIRLMIDAAPQEWLAYTDIKESFHTWRSHYHYWIADWYMRAFFATGHATPLMEAVYHLYQTILNLSTFREHATWDLSARAAAKERAVRRYRRWRNAVCDMAKLLRLGKAPLKKWFGAGNFFAWFESSKIEVIGKNCELPDSIADFLPHDVAKRAEIKAHAHDLVSALKAELDGLSPNINLAIPVSLYCPKRDPTISSNSQRSRFKSSPVQYDNANCWKSTTGVAHELCNAVFNRKGRPKMELSKKVTIIQREVLLKQFRDENLHYAIQELTEWAFFILTRAKRFQVQIGFPLKDDQALKIDPHAQLLWVSVCVLCNSALDLCRLANPTDAPFEQKERIKAQCLYAVALARLGRFYEAHRRLNEAAALLSKMQIEKELGPALSGIIELRRAEVHLLEAAFLKAIYLASRGSFSGNPCTRENLLKRYKANGGSLSKEESFRLVMAKLGDCWHSTELASHLYGDSLYSSRWGARLCMLQLQCLQEFYSLGGATAGLRLSRRNPQSPVLLLRDLLEMGMSRSQSDAFSRLRMIEFAVRAALALSKEHNHNKGDWLSLKMLTMQAIPEKRYVQNDPFLAEYLEELRAFHDKFPF